MKSAIDELHDKAMELADEAYYAKKKDKLEEAQLNIYPLLSMKNQQRCY